MSILDKDIIPAGTNLEEYFTILIYQQELERLEWEMGVGDPSCDGFRQEIERYEDKHGE